MEFALGHRPWVNYAAVPSLRYPDDHRAALVISADFELGWGWRYARVADPPGLARQKARQGRRNLGWLLDVCDHYQLPITWATVGHLLLEGCPHAPGPAHPELPRVPHFRNPWWSHLSGDWFDADPRRAGPAEADWETWYAPDLVRAILSRPTPHELGCHTFSHVPFTDQHCPAEVAAAELRRCQDVAGTWGQALRSFAFPANLAGNLASLRDAGFTAYRCDARYELDVARRDALGMWAIPGGMCLERPYTSWTGRQYAALAKRFIDQAIELGLVASLWFHPEAHADDLEEVLIEVAAHIHSRRSELWITTMGEMASRLSSESEQAADRRRAAIVPDRVGPPPAELAHGAAG